MIPPSSDTKNMTQEDVSKLTKAMKDPQFRGYLDEYCKEISDPGNRKEYLQYLAQLEAKGELPEGQALLRCDPGVCVKTSIRFKNGQVQKCFFNIVHSDRLDDLALKGSEKGGGGQNVHLPYSLSPPRTERDHKDDYCMVCDMAISTGTFMQSVQNPQILKMLVDIAADGLSSKFLQSHEEVSKDFKLLKKVKCKGGEPMPMSVKSELLKGSKKPTKPVDTGGFDGVTPSELKQMKDDAKKKKEAAKKKQKEEQGDGAEEVERKPAAEEKAPPRIRVPKHRLIHSGTVDLADYMSTSEEKSVGPTSTVPKLLKLIVELPTVKKSSDISLEVTSNNVVIEVPGKYYLDLPLSYEIEDSHGTAKFDKAQQTLTLELPVVPKAPDPNTSPFEPAPLAEDDGGLRDGDASSEEEEAPAPASQLAEKNYFRGAKMKEELEQIESELAGSEAPAAMDAGTAPAPGEEQPPPLAKKNELLELEPCGGSLRFADPQLTSSGEAGATEEAAALQSLGAEDDSDMLAEGPAFIAAEKFEGAKAGYYFGLADQGLGYYRDLRQPTRKRAQVAPAAADTRPSALIEEVAALSAEQEQELAPARPPLPADLQRYLDATSACTTRVAAGDREACDVQGELPLDWDQSRQNLSLFISTLPKHRVSDVQLRLAGQVMTVTICTRPEGDSEQLWQRHCIRQKLCGLVDPRQWHAEVVDGTVTITVRKVDPVGMWTQIVDSTVSLPPEAPPCDTSAAPTDKGACSEADGKGSRMPEEPTQPVVSSVGCSIADAVDVDSSELDVAAPVAQGSTSKDMAKTVVGSSQFQAKATAAMVQSATVMGQGVLLRNRFMYELM